MNSTSPTCFEKYELPIKIVGKVVDCNKRRFDECVTASTMEESDRVLIRSVRLQGKQKLPDKQDVYVVVKKCCHLAVYTVQPEGKSGRLHMLHHDLLLPYGFLQPSKFVERPKQKVVRSPRTRASPGKEGMQESESVSQWLESEDEQIPCYKYDDH